MNRNVFLKGWITGARLRGRGAAQATADAGGGSGEYDKASFLAGLAAGFASRGAPMWAYTGEKIRADTEYLLPLGAGIPAILGTVDVGYAEYMMPLGAGIAAQLDGADAGDAEYLLPLGSGIPAALIDADTGRAEYLLPLGAGESVEYKEGS